VVEQLGFLGDQYVAIYPQRNLGAVLQDGDEAKCEDPFNFQEVVRSATGLIQRVDDTARILQEAIMRIDQMVLNEENLTNINITIGNFRLTSEHTLTMVDGINRLVQTNSSPIFITVSNLVRFSEDLDTLAGEMEQAVSTNKFELTKAMKNLQNTTRTLDQLAADIEAGRGLAGTLIKDEHLKANITRIAENFAVLSSNLNKYGLLYKPRQPTTNGVSRSIYPGKNPFK
jgi:phospholipid/cholesterol/gamma-HCH transport system substrate-binding protein